MPLPTPPLSLKGRALRLLSQREHSRLELERKLRRHEQQPGELGRALDELQARGFIDEQRVLESVLHRRAPRLGAARVRQELIALGLGADAVKHAIGELQPSESERALEVWRKKFGAAAAAGDRGDVEAAASRAKQARFLAARGFGAETISRVLRQQQPMPRPHARGDAETTDADETEGRTDVENDTRLHRRDPGRPRTRGF